MNDWKAIRAHYRHHLSAILAERADEWALDPYEWDTGIIELTPIERWLWGDIREAGAILYPQFPIGRYVVDFANPVARVAVECDGAQWHLDKEKDAARDADLASQGWTVYRITGRDCRSEYDPETLKPGAGLLFIQRICAQHQISRDCTRPADDGTGDWHKFDGEFLRLLVTRPTV